ncbi:MAG TPA: hypothetical protein O0X66_07475 [Methanocorpusculum sp.]|nr:hypothetical protein [Methanocorpusculum sp.]
MYQNSIYYPSRSLFGSFFHHHGIPLMILTTLLIQPGYVWDDRLSCTHDPDEMDPHGSMTREGERKK